MDYLEPIRVTLTHMLDVEESLTNNMHHTYDVVLNKVTDSRPPIFSRN